MATGGLSLDFRFFRNVLALAKQFSVPSILGGGVVSSEPERIIRALEPSYAVLSEGERTIVELLSCLEKNGDLLAVKGIAFLQNGRYLETAAREPIMDLEQLPLPDWEGVGLSSYLDKMKPSDGLGWDLFDFPRQVPFLTARSCLYSCTFCFHPIGKKYRQRSLDSVFQELEIIISKFKINIIEIVDELFSVDIVRVKEFCLRFRGLAAKFDWPVKWWCQIRVDKVTDEMLSLMEESGCFLVSYGFESYSERVLRSMKKNISPSQIENAVKLTQRKRLSLQGNFIFGDRAETFETVSETMEFWKKNRKAGILLGIILPLPNSDLYQYCLRKGLIQNPIKFIENHMWNPINLTELGDWDFARLLHMVKIARLKYCVRAIPQEVTRNLVVVVCPFCKQRIVYRNFDITFENQDLFRLPSTLAFFNKMVFCRNCRKRFYASSKLFRLFSHLIQFFSTPLGHFFHLKRTKNSVSLPWLGNLRLFQGRKID
ncbi:MAG: Radical SAM protein [uncultured bacterium]|nr:MAG: Radical SAM protein [uncultured bacterium]